MSVGSGPREGSQDTNWRAHALRLASVASGRPRSSSVHHKYQRTRPTFARCASGPRPGHAGKLDQGPITGPDPGNIKGWPEAPVHRLWHGRVETRLGWLAWLLYSADFERTRGIRVGWRTWLISCAQVVPRNMWAHAALARVLTRTVACRVEATAALNDGGRESASNRARRNHIPTSSPRQ